MFYTRIRCCQGGSSEAVCPLDGFELVLCTMSERTFPICPVCFNDPPFEDARQGARHCSFLTASEMGCSKCPMATCKYSMINQGVCGCAECDGMIVLDSFSAPKWRLACNSCSFLVNMPTNIYSTTVACLIIRLEILVSKSECESCSSALLDIEFNKTNTPLADGKTHLRACVICDPALTAMIGTAYGALILHS